MCIFIWKKYLLQFFNPCMCKLIENQICINYNCIKTRYVHILLKIYALQFFNHLMQFNRMKTKIIYLLNFFKPHCAYFTAMIFLLLFLTLYMYIWLKISFLTTSYFTENIFAHLLNVK